MKIFFWGGHSQCLSKTKARNAVLSCVCIICKQARANVIPLYHDADECAHTHTDFVQFFSSTNNIRISKMSWSVSHDKVVGHSRASGNSGLSKTRTSVCCHGNVVGCPILVSVSKQELLPAEPRIFGALND